MKNAQFNNVRDSWFYKDAANPPVPSMAPIMVGRKVTVLNGYQCNMRINQVTSHINKNQKYGDGVFKADIASKLTSQTNVNAVLYDILARYQNNPNDPAFQNDCRQQLEGKFFIMRDNNASTKIIRLDFNENEKSTFLRGRGDEKVKISYKDYVKDQYGLRANKAELCTLKDCKGSSFLPQFAYLTLRSDECADVYDQILEVTNQPVQERLRRVQALVEMINKSEQKQEIKRAQMDKDWKKKSGKKDLKDKPRMDEKKEKDDEEKDEEKNLNDTFKKFSFKDSPRMDVGLGMQIDEKCIETECLPLNYPDITYRVANGRDKVANIGDTHNLNGVVEKVQK
eukprot:282222_1